MFRSGFFLGEGEKVHAPPPLDKTLSGYEYFLLIFISGLVLDIKLNFLWNGVGFNEDHRPRKKRLGSKCQKPSFFAR